ncbi:hypothetical protein L1994_06365 [Methanomicrobium antiquum]|uniref:CARDB domain-containing protein n=1 Tax=Methanomicrobium antiquum TaxID=487686 RepID=A0AAF0JLU8_9EURY|nr:CARDB domain-containing protein [Methanomicrobium antiquum]WFN35786.1 hypothetical protein L1994_06365 [Methanomicrobium antiquum]
MSEKYNIKTWFAVLVFALILTVPAVSAGDYYYSLDKPVFSPEGLILNGFTVSAESPDIFVGDEITAKYLLYYESTIYNQLVIDQPGGLYFDLTDPDGNTNRLGQNYVGKTIEPGDYYSITEKFVPDRPGIWKISPAYRVIPGSGSNKKSSPDNWNTVEIVVKGIEAPKPDLVIESMKADFNLENGVISKISYTIKNIGEADSESSKSVFFTDGAKNGTESSVGFLPAGESITIFEPVNLKYTGSTTLIEGYADYYKQIDESDENNNLFDIILENPSSDKTQEITVTKDTTETTTQASINSEKTISENQNYNSYCPAPDCCNVCFICGVIGLLSILLCVLSFTLGYYYGLNKNCEREVRWFRSKIDVLKSNSISNKQSVPEDDDIAEKMEEKLERAIKDLKDGKKEDESVDKLKEDISVEKSDESESNKDDNKNSDKNEKPDASSDKKSDTGKNKKK